MRQLDAVKPFFLADGEIHQALHNLGQLAGLSVTPRAVIAHQFWKMYLAAGEVLSSALKRFEADCIRDGP